MGLFGRHDKADGPVLYDNKSLQIFSKHRKDTRVIILVHFQ